MPRRHRSAVLARAALGALIATLAACAPAPSPSTAPADNAPVAKPAAASAAPTTAPAAARPAQSAGAAAPVARPAAKPAPAPAAAAPADSARASALATGSLAATSAATQGGPELPITQSLGRMIIYTTELTILATEIERLPDEIGTLALANGGYVAGVETKDEGGLPTVVVRLRVPPARYEATMHGLRGLAVDVRGEKATTQDITEEFSDVQTQIASLEASHAQLLELMKRAGSVEELLKVQQQAAQVKLQIDRLKGRATALERLSELATITVKAQPADVVLRRDYTAVRAELRKAEATRAGLEEQLRRPRTPEEEAALRDRLGETLLQIARLSDRLAEIEARAQAAHVELPTAEALATTGIARTDDLPKEYIETKIALGRAELQQAHLTEALQQKQPGVDPNALTEKILEVNRLRAQLRTVEERARQANIALPALTPEQEAALIGEAVPPSLFNLPVPVRTAWTASLTVLSLLLTGLVSAVVFLWWALPLAGLALLWQLRRRPAPGGTAQ